MRESRIRSRPDFSTRCALSKWQRVRTSHARSNIIVVMERADMIVLICYVVFITNTWYLRFYPALVRGTMGHANAKIQSLTPNRGPISPLSSRPKDRSFGSVAERSGHIWKEITVRNQMSRLGSTWQQEYDRQDKSIEGLCKIGMLFPDCTIVEL